MILESVLPVASPRLTFNAGKLFGAEILPPYFADCAGSEEDLIVRDFFVKRR